MPTEPRNSGASDDEADAISGAFEVLSSQIAELSAQVRKVIVVQRIQTALLLVVAVAVLTPYISPLADLAG
jgi:hypothetical protein